MFPSLKKCKQFNNIFFQIPRKIIFRIRNNSRVVIHSFFCCRIIKIRPVVVHTKTTHKRVSLHILYFESTKKNFPLPSRGCIENRKKNIGNFCTKKSEKNLNKKLNFFYFFYFHASNHHTCIFSYPPTHKNWSPSDQIDPPPSLSRALINPLSKMSIYIYWSFPVQPHSCPQSQSHFPFSLHILHIYCTASSILCLIRANSIQKNVINQFLHFPFSRDQKKKLSTMNNRISVEENLVSPPKSIELHIFFFCSQISTIIFHSQNKNISNSQTHTHTSFPFPVLLLHLSSLPALYSLPKSPVVLMYYLHFFLSLNHGENIFVYFSSYYFGRSNFYACLPRLSINSFFL